MLMDDVWARLQSLCPHRALRIISYSERTGMRDPLPIARPLARFEIGSYWRWHPTTRSNRAYLKPQNC